ncbi:hypothetical protein GCM10009606_49970 [Nocardioides aquiterrae]|uniref:ATPase AAA-type core domain-containing protein n=1 Tax=Nocardioides aquiterrae TaxID=203799 RepID=A0ABN1UV29_9ACTN
MGKSTMLRELVNELARHPGLPSSAGIRLLRGLSLQTDGSVEDLRAWLYENAHLVVGPQEGFVRLASNQPLPPNSLPHYWGQGDRMGPLSGFMVHYSTPMARGGMVAPAPQRDNIGSPPIHPIHVLQDDAELLKRVDEVSKEVFRQSLTLDRLSGNTFLRVGVPDKPAPPIDAITKQYRDALAALPLLADQGDGMKSLIGLLLPVIAATYPIVVIDEPEAFLHPPQAHQLGKTLATLARERQIQVVLATHDRNLLAGLLAADAPVSVIRLDRSGDATTAHSLAEDEVAGLWTDPVMRYSNVLDGLFHRVVVIAEADPDCRFYAAALDSLNAKQTLPIPPSEILFVPAGGKDGMAKIARSLRAVSVRVVACPDLDILDDKTKIRRLVEVFGGDWSELERNYDVAVEPLKSKKVEATCGEVLKAVEVALSGQHDEAWTEEKKVALRPALRTSQTEFKKLKRFGMATFAGQSAAAAEQLVAQLDALGICCVREGELERLAPALGVTKGPAWVGAALAAGAHEDSQAIAQVQRMVDAAQ